MGAYAEALIRHTTVLFETLAGARSKYEYERCIASASTHYVVPSSLASASIGEYEYDSTRTRGRPNDCRMSEGKQYEYGMNKQSAS